MPINFWHHLFTPHCPNCEHDKECKSCEVLTGLLNSEREVNRQLLNRIIELSHPVEVKEREEAPKVEFKPIRTGKVPWNVRKSILEEEDRAAARIMNELKLQPQTTEDLEKELLGVENAREESKAV